MKTTVQVYVWPVVTVKSVPSVVVQPEIVTGKVPNIRPGSKSAWATSETGQVGGNSKT